MGEVNCKCFFRNAFFSLHKTQVCMKSNSCVADNWVNCLVEVQHPVTHRSREDVLRRTIKESRDFQPPVDVMKLALRRGPSQCQLCAGVSYTLESFLARTVILASSQSAPGLTLHFLEALTVCQVVWNWASPTCCFSPSVSNTHLVWSFCLALCCKPLWIKLSVPRISVIVSGPLLGPVMCP